MNKLVDPFIRTVNVHIDRRVDKGVVDGGIEVDFLVLCSLDLNLVQLGIPGGLALAADSVKVPARRFGAEIDERSLHADGRQGEFQQDLRSFRRMEIEMHPELAAGGFREIVRLVPVAPEAVIDLSFGKIP